MTKVCAGNSKQTSAGAEGMQSSPAGGPSSRPPAGVGAAGNPMVAYMSSSGAAAAYFVAEVKIQLVSTAGPSCSAFALALAYCCCGLPAQRKVLDWCRSR